MTAPPAETFKVGDVIYDADNNPAVVFRVADGQPAIICQCSAKHHGRLTAPPAQLARVKNPALIERARVIGREIWPQFVRSLRPAPAPAPAAAPAAAVPAAFRAPAGTPAPTPEQAAIIDAFLKGVKLVINAFAGSGKTTILKMLAQAAPHLAITYLAFNASAKKDAAAKFPRNATCYTTHGLARQPMAYMADRVGKGKKYLKGAELAKLMRITGPTRLSDARVLAPGQLAVIVRKTISRFCHTADETITGYHVPRDLKGIDEAEIEALKQIVPPIARRIWEGDICTDHGVVPMDFDYYLKAYALTHPELPGDVILLDEAQDSNRCVAAMVTEQMTRYGKQVVMVGDTYQQIYEWRGAVNAMKDFAEIPGVTVMYLSQSFRFGDAIAAEANKVLRILGCPKPLRGFDKIQSRVGPVEGHPDAVLCRTNAEALKQAIHYIGLGLKVAFPKGVGELIKFVIGARDLKAGRPAEHEDLSVFTSWGQVQDFAEAEDDEDLQRMVDLVDEHGVDELLAILEQIGNEDKDGTADITIGTTHAAKGREWKRVEIAADFREPKRDPEQPDKLPKIPAELARLIYVAITRGMEVLDPHGVAWIDHYLPETRAQAVTAA